ncbi:baseplate J/gp47 family protein [Hydrocarboniphaga effusa]|uniref:baseplate J/gp47 family protein n=1 Tax=Hydrocarboniphaga effusa TaxID=243629 RepID=UPI003BA89B9A
MPLTRPTLAELNSRSQADVVTRLAGATPALPRSILGSLVSALAGVLHGLFGFHVEQSKQDVPYTATGIDLERWASIWSVTRKQPTTSSGAAAASGASGIAIPAGTRVRSDAGAVYETTSLVTTAGGAAELSLVAIAAGAAGNQVAGAVLSWVNAPSGLAATVTVGAGGLGGGADLESDDGLRARMLQRIQAPGHGGSADDYRTWALDVAPITRAWVFPLYDGPGSVRVYVANDAHDGPTLASAGDVAAVQSYIDARKPVTVLKEDPSNPGTYINGFEAVAPIAAPVNYVLSIVPDTAENRAAVEAALAELYYRDAVPEGAVSHNKSLVAIGSAGIDDFTLTAPTSTPTADAGEILTLGTVTWP